VENIGYIDPSYPWWQQMDWLLLGIFCGMSLLIMAGAHLRAGALIVFVGAFGGSAIESWGTQAQLWTCFTLERPPLWIIPEWATANKSLTLVALALCALLIAAPTDHCLSVLTFIAGAGLG
jgi:hypothetical protein